MTETERVDPGYLCITRHYHEDTETYTFTVDELPDRIWFDPELLVQVNGTPIKVQVLVEVHVENGFALYEYSTDDRTPDDLIYRALPLRLVSNQMNPRSNP